jgi:uncharacterized CHY-type Zn-finger protein
MSGAKLQLETVGMFDNHINNNNRHVIEDKTLSLTNNICIISRIGDLYLPKKIVCYNCDNNFNINDIKLEIGGQDILKIDCEIINNFINFIEDIESNGNICKIYHLDKTKLFFNIKLLCLSYHEAKIIINKNGNCNNIKLIGKYTYLNTQQRQQMARNSHEDMISQFRYGKFNYTQGTQLTLEIHGNVNGFILSNLNVNNIKSIKMKINNLDRVYYSDNIEILLNTHRINNNTIYVNLNDSHYMDIPTNSSLNCSRIDDIIFIIETEDENIDLHISAYSANILNYASGMSGPKYAFRNNIIRLRNVQQTAQQLPKLKIIIKPIEGNTICPILQDEITDKYICCGVCKYNFDYSVYDNWVKSHKNCPHCRSIWNNNNIYQIKNTHFII